MGDYNSVTWQNHLSPYRGATTIVNMPNTSQPLLRRDYKANIENSSQPLLRHDYKANMENSSQPLLRSDYLANIANLSQPILSMLRSRY